MNDTIQRAADEQTARDRLLAFAKHVNPQYQTPRHIEFLAELLERVERGEIKRLAISAPPGSGKSSLLQIYAGWWLGRHSHGRLLVLSASERLSIRNSRAIQAVVQSDDYPWSAAISDDASSVQNWRTTTGGEVLAVGTGGVLTGHRGDLAICDDLQPDQMTLSTRDALETWFRGVLETRLEPGAPCILIQTRWSTDDLVARLESGEDADQWRVVNLEAICESADDPLGREIGEVLWGERWTPTEMQQKKAAVGGSLIFDALYQGHPRPEGGRLFQEGWFANRYDVLPSTRAVQDDPVTRFYIDPLALARQPRSEQFVKVCAFDGAGKQTTSGSFSALCTVMADSRDDVFVCEVERSREDFNSVRSRLLLHCDRWQPDALIIENAGLGSQMIGSLQASNFRTPIIVVDPSPSRSKEARAISILAMCEGGKVYLPSRAPWLDAFLREILDFPAGRTNDQVDAFVYALQYVLVTQARRRSAESLDRQLQQLGNWMDR